MNINMKATLMAAAIGFGSITVAHAAQQAPEPPRQSAQMPGQPPMMRNMPMAEGQRPMMNNPQMQGKMSEMMAGCRKMMSGMTGQPSRAQ